MYKLSFILIVLLFASCVSSKKFNQLSGDFKNLEQSAQSLAEQNQGLKIQLTELQSKNETLQKDLNLLNTKLSEATKNLENTSLSNQKLAQINIELENQLKNLKTGSSVEIANLMEKLQQVQSDLFKREEILRSAQTELENRSRRLQELELALQQKDEAVKQLRQKVMEALIGFNNKGLSIQEKNGKVYVSLDEQLLFKTGQWDVYPKGQQALSNLADVLGQTHDINVLIECHTDNVPLRATGLLKVN